MSLSRRNGGRKGRIRRNLSPRAPSESDYDNSRDGIDAPDPTDGGGRWPAVGPEDMPADILLARLRRVQAIGLGTWRACCPSHADSRPSLAIRETDDGTLLVKCWSGPSCDVYSITEAVGLTPRYLFPTLTAQAARAHRTGRSMVTTFDSGPTIDEPLDDPPDPECGRLALEACRHSERQVMVMVRRLADDLGVSRESLLWLGVGWDGRRWVIPETDDRGVPVGLSYRYPDGRRKSRGRRGLAIPVGIDGIDPDGPLYLAEGISDAAALLSVGVCAVGRPMALDSHLTRYWVGKLARRLDRPGGVIVVGDADPVGREGAGRLATSLAGTLKRTVRWAVPARGHGDVRDQVTAGHWHRGLRTTSVEPYTNDSTNEGY